MDMRQSVAAFIDKQGIISSSVIGLQKQKKKGQGSEVITAPAVGDKGLWVATTNKYFSAITVPIAKEGKNSVDWIGGFFSTYYNPDRDEKDNTGDETMGSEIRTAAITLGPVKTAGSIKNFNFNIYLGPKDKRLFDDTPYYKQMGFVHSINFRSCFCCPAGIIRPLAFFILWLMNGIYTGIPNYGVAIIIMVILVRTVLHPLTKSGQVRMNRFSKVMAAPEIQEIKKKYSKNKKNQMEMQKKISEFTKSKGVSPLDALFGMMPMMVQMPLWIALWSAVNTSVDLRGAAFLPFWITDLSAPDALFRFSTVTLPLLGWKISSFNLLPILMGVAFYLQQKTMPQQAAATPEQQQQQKIMKYMMLIMFPIMLYSAPSGVNLYIMASSFAGAMEQYVIRKHIREKEQEQSRGLIEVTSKTGGKIKKKKPKPFYKNM
jgi:YidC/Oxa1 family membrane protein insertase